MKELCLICNKYVVKILAIDGMNICYDCYQQQDNDVRRFKRNSKYLCVCIHCSQGQLIL